LLLICGSLVATGFLIWREASAGSSAGWQREETQLDRNAREIREALAKPIPPPEPLPAITARPARTMAASSVPRKLKPISPEALNAMAMEHNSAPSPSGHVGHDRHAIR
jgi:hypothetical protein